AVTLTVDATTSDTTPEVRVSASDLNGLPDGTAVALDIDLNNDGDFADANETGNTTSTLTGGLAVFQTATQLAVGTVRMRARVTDRAGNEGTSATKTVQIVSSGPGGAITDTTPIRHPRTGDDLLQRGNYHPDHALYL